MTDWWTRPFGSEFGRWWESGVVGIRVQDEEGEDEWEDEEEDDEDLEDEDIDEWDDEEEGEEWNVREGRGVIGWDEASHSHSQPPAHPRRQ